MSVNPPPTAPGTHAPSHIELLWERYKSLVYVILLAALGALAANYAIAKYNQSQRDSEWSKFAATIGLDAAYVDPANAGIAALADRLDTVDKAQLEAAAAGAPESQKPYLLLALARKSIATKEWDAAEAALRELETKFPDHSLVKTSAHPVQAREAVPEDPAATTPRTKTEWKPAVAGSAVGLVRAQIAAAKDFAPPTKFAKHEVPADAPRIKFDFSGDYGSITIALMPQTPLHRDAVLALAKQEEPFWKGVAVDEVRRPAKNLKQPREMHFGFASTKNEVRAEWTDTEPSTNLVEFESSPLSHFAGAVSARVEKDGKSCADRFWILYDDAPQYDGQRVIFAYVVDGLENVKRICSATMMTTAEEEQGRGKPEDVIRVTGVTVLQ